MFLLEVKHSYNQRKKKTLNKGLPKWSNVEHFWGRIRGRAATIPYTFVFIHASLNIRISPYAVCNKFPQIIMGRM